MARTLHNLRWLQSPCCIPELDQSVHLWGGSIDDPITSYLEMSEILSKAERSKADRLINSLDRDRFVARRVVRRIVLSRYLGIPPSDVEFIQTGAEKPRLCGLSGGEAIEFSTTHSDGAVIVAVSRDCKLGVDIERMRTLMNLESLQETCMSIREQTELNSLPPKERSEGFLRCWVSKEAVLKAISCGLSADPRDVPIRQVDGQVDLTAVNKWGDALRTVSIVHGSPCLGYVGAMAILSEFQHQMKVCSYRLPCSQ